MNIMSEQALAVREEPRTLSLTQVRTGLDAIRQVMRECMTEGQDYGKVPGCGDKPGLFQPGAQKLSMMFQLCPEVQKEEITDYPNFHRGYRLIVRVASGGKFADGVGECSTMESKYRYRNAARKCPACGKESIIKGKAEFGGGWLCYQKKGGCGEKWADGTEQANAFESDGGKVENENPADHWNTTRKMAFKRAFVHAIINATNTSELWSQDLEDLAANGITPQEPAKAPPTTPKPPKTDSGANAGQSGARHSECRFENYEVRNGQNAKGPWTCWICHFTDDAGNQSTASTFSKTIADVLDTLKGEEVIITYKPGRKEGTYELMSISPNDKPPME